jgi:hypothetical protein
MIRRRLSMCAIMLACAVPTAVCAGNEALLDSPTSKDGRIAAWNRQLDSDQFAKRQEASLELKALGVPAIGALAKSATADSREVRRRAMDILRQHLSQGTDAEKDAAKVELQKLAAGAHASSARRASEILKPPGPPRPAAPFALQGVRVQIQRKLTNGKHRIQIAPQGRQIDVEADGRQIKINEAKDGSIEIELTEKKNGKQVKKKYAAKNEAELKKKHPEAHKLYKKHNLPVRAIQIQFRIGPQIAPPPPKP